MAEEHCEAAPRKAMGPQVADQVEVVVPQQVGLDGLAVLSEEAGEAGYSPALAPW